MTRPEPLKDDPFKDDDGEAGGGFIFGIAGPTGTGKTFTALRLARGAAAHALGLDYNDVNNLAAIDAAIAFIDTESRRALHYKARGDQRPTLYTSGQGCLWGFRHAELDAPYTPDAYYKLIDAADARGYKAIIVDSWSHSWDGEGGLQDMHDDDLDRDFANALTRAEKNNNGNLPPWWRDDEQRDKLSIGAWRGPKRANKRLVNRMLRANAHLIICMRAEDKLRIETEKQERQKRNGDTYTVNKTTITAPKDMPPGERWAPICEKRLPYEFTVGLVLTPEQQGKPYAMKPLQQQLRPMFDFDNPLDESAGFKLAAWARTGERPGQSKPFDMRQRADHSPSSVSSGGGAPNPLAPPPPPSSPVGGGPSSPVGGGAVRFWGVDYDPATPDLLPYYHDADDRDFTETEWKAYAHALRTLIERAPGDAAKRQWAQTNAPGLLIMAAISPPLRGWTVAFVPQDPDAFPGDVPAWMAPPADQKAASEF